MSSKKEKPKYRMRISSIFAAQFRQAFGAEPPGELDPGMEGSPPPITASYTEWERNKFARMIGQVPSRFEVKMSKIDSFGTSVSLGIGSYNVLILAASIEGVGLMPDQLGEEEYLPIDLGDRVLSWVEKAENGIDLLFGQGDQRVLVNARLWCAVEKPPNIEKVN